MVRVWLGDELPCGIACTLSSGTAVQGGACLDPLHIEVQVKGCHTSVQVQQRDLGTTQRRNPAVCIPSWQQDVQC